MLFPLRNYTWAPSARPGWESVVCGGEHGAEPPGSWLGVGRVKLAWPQDQEP